MGDEIRLQRVSTEKEIFPRVYNIKSFSKISINERTIVFHANPERILFHSEYRYNKRYREKCDHSEDYRIRRITLHCKKQIKKIEEELRKPEYGLNVVSRKADDRVVPKKTGSRDLKVLQSILDEAGIPDAGHRRLAAPSPVTIEAPDTPSFTAYTLLFSGILFAGFLLTKCLRKRNLHRRSFTREDEGAL